MDPFTMAILGTVAQEGVKGIFGALSPKPDTVTLGSKPNFGNPATFGQGGGMAVSSYHDKQPITPRQQQQGGLMSGIASLAGALGANKLIGGLGGKGGGGLVPDANVAQMGVGTESWTSPSNWTEQLGTWQAPSWDVSSWGGGFGG